QLLADHCNRYGAPLVALVDFTSGQEWNLHRREKTRSSGQDASVIDSRIADLHFALERRPGKAGADDRGARQRRAAHSGYRFEPLAQVLVKSGDLRVVMSGLARIHRE